MQIPDDVPGMLEKFQQVICDRDDPKTPGSNKKCKADSCIDIMDKVMLHHICTCMIPGGNYYNLAKDQIWEFKRAAYADMEATIDAFKRHYVRYMHRTQSNWFKVGCKLLYQFMEHNSVLLSVSVTDYIAKQLEKYSECANLFAPGWLSPK
jgi:hypothetical protein